MTKPIYTDEYFVEWQNDDQRLDEWWIDLAVHDLGWGFQASITSIDHTAEALSADDLRGLAVMFADPAHLMEQHEAARKRALIERGRNDD